MKPKYYTHNKGRLQIQRSFNGRSVHYCYCDNIEQVEDYLAVLERINWDYDLFKAFLCMVERDKYSYDTMELTDLMYWWWYDYKSGE